MIEKEIEWRKACGRPEGFQCLRACRPLVAAGADGPLEDQLLMADYFRKPGTFWILARFREIYRSLAPIDGVDGLAGVHTSVSCHSVFRE